MTAREMDDSHDWEFGYFSPIGSGMYCTNCGATDHRPGPASIVIGATATVLIGWLVSWWLVGVAAAYVVLRSLWLAYIAPRRRGVCPGS